MKWIFKAVFIFLIFISQAVQAYQAAVVSANKEASAVGMKVLQAGGNAADAAIATAFALGVVEPQNSGIGGGGFLLYYDAKEKKFSFLDYRETAPARIASLKDKNKIQEGITSVGVPGFVLGMETAHKQLGHLAWKDLLSPSVELAKKGLNLSGTVENKIQEERSTLEKDPTFQKEWVDKKSVDLKRLADTLAEIADEGSRPFYQGAIAQKIAAFMKIQKGLIDANDLRNYRPLWRKPFQFEKNSYTVVSSGSPSSGGQGMSLLFRKAVINRVNQHFPYSSDSYVLLVEGMKDYFDFRAAALGDSSANVIGHTTHLNVIDAEGNIAAMTNTLNSPFGSGLIVPDVGIILNDEMADFSLEPSSPNRPQAGRRPLSSMSPTIVLQKGKPVLVIGTPGGLTIPQNLFQILFATWEWKSTLSGAISQPKLYYSPHDKKIIAEAAFSKRVLKKLEEKYTVETKPKIGNVQALVIKSEKVTQTLSDPRGEGGGVVN